MPSNWELLKELLPPPESPSGLHRSWQIVESALGLTLPTDYKRFIDTWGSGCISPSGGEFGTIVIWNLRAVPNVLNWVTTATRRYDDDEISGTQHPFRGYPNQNGLLAWATTPDGDFLNWHVNGKPNDWEIVFYHFSTKEMVVLDNKKFTEVLVELLQLNSPLMPYPIDPDSFRPPCEYVEEVW